MKASFYILFFLIVIILGSFAINIFLFQKLTTPHASSQVQLATQYSYLSPRIFADKRNDILINFVPLRLQLNDYIASLSDKFGVYFEYLPSGVSIGVNDTDEFVLVSLLKVPVVMAVYKNVEQGTTSLSDMLTITKADQDSKFGTLYQQPVGTKVSVQDAIHLTLTDSDNTAKNLLGHTLNNEDILDVFDYLDIPKDSKNGSAVVSPKNYSSILRSLYLSSYVDKEHSNQILTYLSQSIFKDKLPAGIPSGIHVAHKIGVYDPNDNSTPIYTDCGTVYVPNRPYIVCMMTQAKETKAREYMQKASHMVYQYVSTANK